MTRIQHWEKLLKARGYSLIYDTYAPYSTILETIPFAADSEGNRILLAYEGTHERSSFIKTILSIVANEDNLDFLIDQGYRNDCIEPDPFFYGVTPIFKNGSIIKFKFK